MSFFDSLPEPQVPPGWEDEDDPPPPPPWLGPPDDVLGVPVPIVAVVHRDQHVVVALAGLVAYPTGVHLRLRLAVRRGDWSIERWSEVQDAFWEEGLSAARGRARGALRVGVQLPDGRRTSTTAPFERGIDPKRPPEPPVLVGELDGGGSGGMRSLESTRGAWLWPLPDGDTFDLVLDWPGLDVPLTRHAIDARAVRAAAGNAVPLWP